jgi:hypothetical protein
MSVLASSREILAKGGNTRGERALGTLERLKECFIGGVLKSAYAGLLVTGKCKDISGCRNVVIGILEITNCLLRVADLPDEGSRDEQEGHYWK